MLISLVQLHCATCRRCPPRTPLTPATGSVRGACRTAFERDDVRLPRSLRATDGVARDNYGLYVQPLAWRACQSAGVPARSPTPSISFTTSASSYEPCTGLRQKHERPLRSGAFSPGAPRRAAPWLPGWADTRDARRPGGFKRKVASRSPLRQVAGAASQRPPACPPRATRRRKSCRRFAFYSVDGTPAPSPAAALSAASLAAASRAASLAAEAGERADADGARAAAAAAEEAASERASADSLALLRDAEALRAAAASEAASRRKKEDEEAAERVASEQAQAQAAAEKQRKAVRAAAAEAACAAKVAAARAREAKAKAERDAEAAKQGASRSSAASRVSPHFAPLLFSVSILVYVRHGDGCLHKLVVLLSDSVLDVKRQIQALTGKAAHMHLLVLRGRFLQDNDRTMAACGILKGASSSGQPASRADASCAEDVLRYTLRLLGGGGCACKSGGCMHQCGCRKVCTRCVARRLASLNLSHRRCLQAGNPCDDACKCTGCGNKLAPASILSLLKPKPVRAVTAERVDIHPPPAARPRPWAGKHARRSSCAAGNICRSDAAGRHAAERSASAARRRRKRRRAAGRLSARALASARVRSPPASAGGAARRCDTAARAGCAAGRCGRAAAWQGARADSARLCGRRSRRRLATARRWPARRRLATVEQQRWL